MRRRPLRGKNRINSQIIYIHIAEEKSFLAIIFEQYLWQTFIDDDNIIHKK